MSWAVHSLFAIVSAAQLKDVDGIRLQHLEPQVRVSHDYRGVELSLDGETVTRKSLGASR